MSASLTEPHIPVIDDSAHQWQAVPLDRQHMLFHRCVGGEVDHDWQRLDCWCEPYLWIKGTRWPLRDVIDELTHVGWIH